MFDMAPPSAQRRPRRSSKGPVKPNARTFYMWLPLQPMCPRMFDMAFTAAQRRPCQNSSGPGSAGPNPRIHDM
eukprot:2183233-Pyramimonas_sp.AAC.1